MYAIIKHCNLYSNVIFRLEFWTAFTTTRENDANYNSCSGRNRAERCHQQRLGWSWVLWVIISTSNKPLVCYFCCFDFETCSNFCFSVAEQNKSVYLLDNCPHDWLFPRCTAVVPSKFFSVEVLFFLFKLNSAWKLQISGTSRGCWNNCRWS